MERLDADVKSAVLTVEMAAPVVLRISHFLSEWVRNWLDADHQVGADVSNNFTYVI
jgi:hypothetical protein